MNALKSVARTQRVKGVVNCQNQKAIVPVGRPRPYSIITLNMRFIPKASLRASSQITASSYILERHLWVNNSKHFALPLLGRWLAKKNWLYCYGDLETAQPQKLVLTLSKQKHLYDLMLCWTSVENVWPTWYKCYTNVLCMLGCRGLSLKHCTFIQCWFNVGPASQTLA